jgi:hypothetical protein
VLATCVADDPAQEPGSSDAARKPNSPHAGKLFSRRGQTWLNFQPIPEDQKRAPQRFGDILETAYLDRGKIHLDQRFLDRTLTPTGMLDEGRFGSLRPKLRIRSLTSPAFACSLHS